MPVNKSGWAIDIGQCALKAIHGQITPDNTIQIDGLHVITHEKMLSQPDVDEKTIIETSLNRLIEQAGPSLGKEPIIISIPGHKSFARFSKLPPVEPKKLADIIKYEATQQIPFGIEEVIWDYHIFKSEDSPDVEVGIFAVKRNIISQYLQYFYDAGLSPKAVQMVSVAIYNACMFEGLIGPEAIVIADVGVQNTNFLIAEGHKLWTRNIPIGGNNFTEALQRAFKLNFEKAEHLKRTATTSKYVRTAFQAMRPVFSELATEFQRSIGFYTSVNRESEIKQIYVLGNTFRLPGLVKFIQQNTGIPVKKIENYSKVRLAEGLNEMEFSENILTLTPAYGLLTQLLGQGVVDTDLTPPEVLKEQIWKKKQFWFVGTAASLALAAGLVWLRANSDLSAIRNDKEQNEPRISSIIQRYKRYQSEYQKYANPSSRKSPITSKIEEILEQRNLLPLVINEILSSVPQRTIAASLSSEETYKQAVMKIPRNKRQIAHITSIDISYVPDLTEEAIKQLEATAKSQRLKISVRRQREEFMYGPEGIPEGGYMPPGGEGMMPPQLPGAGRRGIPPMGPGGPGMEPGIGPGAGFGRGREGFMMRREKTTAKIGKKAFLITINGITPHEDAPTFLTNTIVRNLKEKNKEYAIKNNLNFWIDHVKLISSMPLAAADSEGGRIPGTEEKKIDPITNEAMDKDVAFTITCVVHIGNPKEDKKS